MSSDYRSHISPEEWQNLVLSIATHKKKRRLSPIQVAKILEKIYKQADINQLSRDLQIQGPTLIYKFLSLLKLPEELQNFVDFGNRVNHISFSSAL